MKVAPQYEAGQGGRRPVGLPRLPQARRERQQRARARTDPHRRRASRARRSSARSRSARASCPPSATCRRRSSTSSPTSSPRSTEPAPVASIDECPSGPRPTATRARLRAVRGAGQPHVRPDRGRLRPAELGDDRRACTTAGASGPPTGPSSGPATRALDVCCGTGDLALELRRPGRARRPRGRLRLLRADARPRPREGGGARRRRRPLRVGRRARAALRRRPLRRRHGRLRRPQPRRPRPRPAPRWRGCCGPAAGW